VVKKSNFVTDSLKKARSQQAAYVLLCVGFSILLLSRGPASLLRRDVVSIVSAAAATLSFMQFRTLSAKAGRLSAGASAEKAVAKCLSSQRIKHVLHSVDLSAGGDADHIILGPVCAVIETKYAKGNVASVQGGLTAAGRRLPRDPVAQARRQAAALRRVSGVWSEAVVCMTGMTNRPFKDGDVVVCSLKDLPGVIDSLSRPLSGNEADRVASLLGVPNLRM